MSAKALILAGGFGTRLRSVVNDVPKPLAPINGIPFLKYLLEQIYKQNIVDEIILATGFKGEMVERVVGSKYKDILITYCQEQSPLGTGGAIKLGLSSASTRTDNFFVFNGDTFADVDLLSFLAFHQSAKADITIASTKMHDFDRYGSLTLDHDHKIVSFNEKKYLAEGLINCGVYLLSRQFVDEYLLTFPLEKFSMEKDILETAINSRKIQAFVSQFYFIDIGIPEDYERAQTDFKEFRFK